MAQYYKKYQEIQDHYQLKGSKQVHELILQLLGFAHKWEQWLTMIVCTAGFCLCSWPSFRQTHLSVRFAGSFLSLGLRFGPEARFGHSRCCLKWVFFCGSGPAERWKRVSTVNIADQPKYHMRKKKQSWQIPIINIYIRYIYNIHIYIIYEYPIWSDSKVVPIQKTIRRQASAPSKVQFSLLGWGTTQTCCCRMGPPR